jgi:hypothetical protein
MKHKLGNKIGGRIRVSILDLANLLDKSSPEPENDLTDAAREHQSATREGDLSNSRVRTGVKPAKRGRPSRYDLLMKKFLRAIGGFAARKLELNPICHLAEICKCACMF